MADVRRRFRVPSLVVAVLLVLAGCAAPAPDQFDNRGPIIFATGPDNSSGRQVAQLTDKWNALRGYSEPVSFVEMPSQTDDFRAQLRVHSQDLAHANRFDYPSQCYDVMSMDIVWAAEFAKAGYLVPLDRGEFPLDTYLKRPVEAVTLDGKLWAIPTSTDAGLLYYRKDLLDKAGAAPPRTWDELITQASTIAPQDHVDGYVGQFEAGYEGLTVNAMEAIWANSGDVLTPAGKVVADSPQTKAGVRMLAHGVEAGWIPRGALRFNEERSREAFQQGHALFMRNWPYAYRLLADPKSPVSGKFGVTALPGPSALGGWNLGVSTCSTHRQTARDFIRFLTSESSQRQLFQSAGFAPTIATVYDDPALRQQFPYLDVIRRSVENSRNRPATPYYDDVSGAIQEYLTNALNNPVSADAMTEALAERLTAVTQGH